MNRPDKFNAAFEVAIIIVICLLTYIFSGYYDVLEKIVSFSAKYEEYELDELISTALVLTFFLLFSIYRRSRIIQSLNSDLVAKNNELLANLEEIKKLKGIIPICSFCKSIRDDDGYWESLEKYFKDHSDTDFSHGICPTCMKENYSEYISES